MNILCTICSDLVRQIENIYMTKCGHVFHFHCLSQWIERSQTCPQCRHKVTHKCMYRMFPTISNENCDDDVATLRQRLDDSLLQLRQEQAASKDQASKLVSAEAELKKKMELLIACEKKLASRDTAIAGMREQLEYYKDKNKEVEKLKEENDTLKKNIQTLNGLQAVLNAGDAEVERMLEDYTDVRTVATFATALKRALCESESKKKETRDRLQAVKLRLAAEKAAVAELQDKLAYAEDKLALTKGKYKSLKNNKRKYDVLTTVGESSILSSVPSVSSVSSVSVSPSVSVSSSSVAKKSKPDMNAVIYISDDNDTSFNTMVNNIESAESPYLRLQQSSLAHSALTLARASNPRPLPNKALKPSEYALLNSARNADAHKLKTYQRSKLTSIFEKKDPPKLPNLSEENDPNLSFMDISYDGLGGHSKLDTFPTTKPKSDIVARSCIPKLSAKHKLRRPNPVGSQDISKMLDRINSKIS